MNIGEAATLSGVPAKTIRYYESIGLLRPGARAANGYRAYDAVGVQELRFIARGRSLGFSVKDIGALLALYRDKQRASRDVKAMALRHIVRIDAKLKELDAMRATLADLAAHCHGDQRPDCPILKDLAAPPASPL
jgi:MerR family copper efflux transcriptional regulator